MKKRVRTVKPVYSDHLWAAKNAGSREVVTFNRGQNKVYMYKHY